MKLVLGIVLSKALALLAVALFAAAVGGGCYPGRDCKPGQACWQSCADHPGSPGCPDPITDAKRPDAGETR